MAVEGRRRRNSGDDYSTSDEDSGSDSDVARHCLRAGSAEDAVESVAKRARVPVGVSERECMVRV